MNCQETQSLLHGYVDSELDLVRSLEIERHLRDCADCAHRYQAQQALRAALRGGGLAFQAPPALRQRLGTALRQASQARSPRRVPWPWISAAAGVAATVALTWGLVHFLSGPSEQELLTREVVSSHVRSLLANHLTDVKSSDRHTVGPWLTDKLTFSPPVPNLTSQGFPLVGGRLDYLDGQRVAAVVYRRRKHLINLFIWPSASTSRADPQRAERQGFQVVHWARGGMTYWAVSDVNSNDLRTFVRLIQERTSPTRSP